MSVPSGGYYCLITFVNLCLLSLINLQTMIVLTNVGMINQITVGYHIELLYIC
jgi:hypothetical protein